MGMPKQICETFANILCNEKTKISISNEESTKRLNRILDKNHFYVKANQAIEKSFALGFGAFVLSANSRAGIRIQFISADNIIPLEYDNCCITECAFMSDSYDLEGEKIRYIQVHKKDEKGNYVILNFRFFVSPDGNMSPSEMNDLPEVIETGSGIPWFSIIKPNVVNNLDMNSPFGIPVYFNALDVIKSLDIMYDSLVNEIHNGRKRLFVTSDALKVNSEGQLKNAFDPNDVIFYLLDSTVDNATNKYVQEINGELRINEIRLAIRTSLEILAFKLGFGKNYYQLGDFGNVMKTATEVISSNAELYNTIHKHEILLYNSFKTLIEGIQFISKNIFGESIDGDVFIDFDDSVIESDASRREQDRRDVSMGAMTIEEYRSIWYNEPLELARRMVQKNSNVSSNQS